MIKYSTLDAGYISNLLEDSKHSYSSPTITPLTGEIVNYSPTATEATATALKSASTASKLNNKAVLLKDDKKYLI
ncbi:MAG: hypothetical protein IJZ62_02840 [Clostridia bacterium]|nr:hypothetical protein [Clostridia bacterium]